MKFVRISSTCYCPSDPEEEKKFISISSTCYCPSDPEEEKKFISISSTCDCPSDPEEEMKFISISSTCYCPSDPEEEMKFVRISSTCDCSSDPEEEKTARFSGRTFFTCPATNSWQRSEDPMSGRRFRADDPERKRWQDPEHILDAIGLAPGMTIVDAGCGEGFFALPAARRAGPQGRVIAFDINPDAVAALQEQAGREGLVHLTARAGAAEETVPCEGCADIVLFANDLHDFADAQKAIENAHRMLRPGGTLANLDWKVLRMDFGPPFGKRLSPQKAAALLQTGGFRILSVQDAGPYHYLILAEP